MSLSIENQNTLDWGDLIAKVNLYTYGRVVQEDVWDRSECADIAYDITMEAVKACLEQTRKGALILNPFSYIIKTVSNELRNEKYIAKCIVDRHSKSGDISSNQDYDDGSEYDIVTHKTESKPAFSEIDDSENDHLQVIADHLKSCGLTAIEISVATLCYQGFKGKEISVKIGISASGVSRMLRLIKTKLT